MSHSPEPWCVGPSQSNLYKHDARHYSIRDANGKIVLDTETDQNFFPSDEDRDRVVACINACRGIPTEALTPDSVLDSLNEMTTKMRAGVHLNGRYVEHIVVKVGDLPGDFARVIEDLCPRLPELVTGKTGEVHFAVSFEEKPTR